MSKPNFTPGPWIITVARGFTSNRKLIQTADGEDIAGTCYHEPEQTMANAALIAAAPEMYEMLDQFRRYIAEGPLGTRGEMYRRIDALLAKARGEVQR